MSEQHPIIWEALDAYGRRCGMVTAMTKELAEKNAKKRFGNRLHRVLDTGKRRKPLKCCDHCGDTPCGGEKK